jgi:hypothetical protein
LFYIASLHDELTKTLGMQAQIAMEDFTSVKGQLTSIRARGILNTIFSRRDVRSMSRVHLETLMLVDKHASVSWGALFLKALEDEFNFAISQQPSPKPQPQSTALAGWATQYFRRLLARLHKDVPYPIVHVCPLGRFISNHFMPFSSSQYERTI